MYTCYMFSPHSTLWIPTPLAAYSSLVLHSLGVTNTHVQIQSHCAETQECGDKHSLVAGRPTVRLMVSAEGDGSAVDELSKSKSSKHPTDMRPHTTDQLLCQTSPWLEGAGLIHSFIHCNERQKVSRVRLKICIFQKNCTLTRMIVW